MPWTPPTTYTDDVSTWGAADVMALGNSLATPLAAVEGNVAAIGPGSSIYAMASPYNVVAGDTGDQGPGINAAIVALGAAGGRVVLPPGTVRHSTRIDYGKQVRLEGASKQGTILNYTGTDYAIQFGSGAAIEGLGPGAGYIENWRGLNLSNVWVKGSSSAKGGIRVRGALGWVLDSVQVTGFTNATDGYGLLFEGGSFIATIRGACRFYGNRVGIQARVLRDGGGVQEVDGRGAAFNAISLHGACEIQGNVYGMVIGEPAATAESPVAALGNFLSGFAIEGNTTGGLWIASAEAMTIKGVYFESNGTFDVRVGSTAGNLSQPVGVVFEDCSHVLGSGYAYDIVRSSSVTIKRPVVDGSGGTAFKLTTTANRVNIEDHIVRGSVVATLDNAGAPNLTIRPRNERYAKRAWAPTGARAETFPLRGAAVNGSIVLTSGTLLCVGGAVLPAGEGVASIVFRSGAAAVTPTNQWAALIRQSDRQILAVSTDRTTEAWVSNAPKTFPMAATYYPTDDEAVYFGLLMAATTPVALRAAIADATIMAMPPVLCGSSNTGLTTPLTVGTVVSALTAVPSHPYAYAL